MSEKMNNNPIINPDTLAEMESLQMDGEPDIVVEIFSTFLEVTPARLNNLTQLAKAGDIKALSKEAHALKSSARTIGALRLGDHCQQMEHIEDLGLIDQKMELLAKIKSSLDEVFAEIKKIRPGIK